MDKRKMVSFPECILCKTSFKVTGPTPYLLPCLHAVCDQCMKRAAIILICPCCPKHQGNQETKLKEDIVRKEFVLHLTAKNHPSELLCSHEEDGNQAVSWCIDCQELFCEFCYNLHCGFKALKGHVFKSVEELAEETKDGMQKLSNKDNDLLKIVRNLKESCEKEIQQIDSNSSALQKSEEVQKENISHTFKVLHSLLDQREREVMLQFESKQHESHMKHSNTLQKVNIFCKSIFDYNLLASTVCIPDDDLDLSDVMKMARLYSSCISNVSVTTTPSIKFVPEGLPRLRENICGFAKICTRYEAKTNQKGRRSIRLNTDTSTWMCPHCRQNTLTCSACKGQGKEKAKIGIFNAPTGDMVTGVMKKQPDFSFGSVVSTKTDLSTQISTSSTKPTFSLTQTSTAAAQPSFSLSNSAVSEKFGLSTQTSTTSTAQPSFSLSNTAVSAKFGLSTQTPTTSAAQPSFSLSNTAVSAKTDLSTQTWTTSTKPRFSLSTSVSAKFGISSQTSTTSIQPSFTYSNSTVSSKAGFSNQVSTNGLAFYRNRNASITEQKTTSFAGFNFGATSDETKRNSFSSGNLKSDTDSKAEEAWMCTGCSALNSSSTLSCHICKSRKK